MELTDCLTEYINFCVDTSVPVKTVCFPNNKPWVTKDIKALLIVKKRALRSADREGSEKSPETTVSKYQRRIGGLKE